jgi:hypothetical protein
MTTDLTTLQSLRDRVANATAATSAWELSSAVLSATISVDAPDADDFYGSGSNCVTSIDAALALVERLLPGWRVELETLGKGRVQSFCTLRHVDVCGTVFGAAPTPALATILAMLDALIDQMKGNDDDHD